MAARKIKAAKLARLASRVRVVQALNRIVFVGLCASVGFVVVASAVPQRHELEKLEARLEEAREREGHVLAERERMRVEHRALREDPEFLETQARDRLDYCRDGERVLRLQRDR